MTRLLAVAVASVLVLAGGASAASKPWPRYADPVGGFSIAVPPTWRVVPRSTANLNALVARLTRSKQTALANQYGEVAAARRVTHTVYRFQAFAWPAPKGAVVPDVTVKVDQLRKGTKPGLLPGIAQQIVKALRQSRTTTVVAPVRRSLPAGQAIEVSGTTRISGSLRSRYAIYLLIHGLKLYSLSFRGPATTVESRIARDFSVS